MKRSVFTIALAFLLLLGNIPLSVSAAAINVDPASYTAQADNDTDASSSDDLSMTLPELFTVKIGAVDRISGDMLTGVTMQITDEDGNEKARWQSTAEVYAVSLYAGTYTLLIEAAPDGYALPTDGAEEMTFTVDTDGTVGEYDPETDMLCIAFTKTAVQFLPMALGTKYQITYKDKDGKTQYLADDDGNTEFVVSFLGTKQLSGFVAGVEYTVSFTYVDEAHESGDDFTFGVDAYGNVIAEPIEDKVDIIDNCIVFHLKAIPAPDDDGKDELDNDDNGTNEGATDSDDTDTEDGKADVNVDADNSNKNNKPTGTPQTGDSSNIALWAALLFISGGVLVSLTVYNRKKEKL